MAKKNYSYCKNGESVVYADAVIDDGNTIFVNPTKEQYGNAGWYKLIREYPECPEGQMAVEKEHAEWDWNDADMTVTVTYRFEDEPEPEPYVEHEPVPEPEPVPPPPRIFSKLKCYAALKELGCWERVKLWLETSDLWDAFILAQNVSEEHPQFVQGLNAIKTTLGLSDEQVETILANCVED